MSTVLYVRYQSDEMPLAWHTLCGSVLRKLCLEQDSQPLNFTIQYLLTDISAENCGDFCYVGSSYRRDFPEGWIQFDVEAGDAALGLRQCASGGAVATNAAPGRNTIRKISAMSFSTRL